MSDCCSPINIPPNCPNQCNQITDACCVKDETAYSCIGTAAEATQCQINAAVNAKLCSILNGSTPCYDSWVSMPLEATVINATSTTNPSYTNLQAAEYSLPVLCIVRLRGLIETVVNFPETDCFHALIAQLPFAPKKTRIFSVVISIPDHVAEGCLKTVGWIIIESTGNVYLDYRSSTRNPGMLVSLDSISFEINV